MTTSEEPVTTPVHRRRDRKPAAEVVLICNPRAGGRWKELAAILDSQEGKHVRRIVTDSVEDIAPAIAGLGHEAKLICVYGGDGTIQRVLDRLSPNERETTQLAFLGGGTMNVTAGWCGFGGTPAENFREVVRAYLSGQLHFKEVPLLEVHHGGTLHRGFTFGIGPLIRVLDAYERGRKGKLGALATAAQAAAAAFVGFPAEYAALLAEMEARVTIDDDELPHNRFTAIIANVTGQINPGVVPFVDERTRDSFYFAAYAVPAREFTFNVPILIRGWLPIDRKTLFRPDQIVKRVFERYPLKKTLPADPRYVNCIADHLEIDSDERMYTLDGEILPAQSGRIVVSMGPHVRLAVSSNPGLRQASSMVARRFFGRW